MTRLRKEIGEIEEDRDLLGNQRIAVLQRRNLSHRVYRQVCGLALLSCPHIEHMELIGRTKLFE
jgi:hypothetical protein